MPGTTSIVATSADDADLERRFGGLRRLYGAAAYARLRAAWVAVVGLGGVGSWAAEALARSGVAGLVLIDLDHVAESNINRQVQALGSTVGMAKAEALRRRIADIHPGCVVQTVEDFVTPANWPRLLHDAWAGRVDGVIDACDQGAAKLSMAKWALHAQVPLVVCGAAGGKAQAHRVELDDLSAATHDRLLATLRQRLRRDGAPRTGRIGLSCVFSRETSAAPVDADCPSDGSLNCHGFGSSVTVTASFGMVAAGAMIERLIKVAQARDNEKKAVLE